MRKFEDLPMTTDKSMTYAGIGHRDLGGFTEPNTKEPVENVMAWIAGKLEQLGYTLNSGGAKGADAAFEYGVKDAVHKNIFRPSDATEETRAIAQELHPSHEWLKGHALDLYARNTNQVFGRNLDKTIDFIVCYTKDGCESYTTRSRDSGGTGQAIEMATRKGAPVFNMKNADWFVRLKRFLNESGTLSADADFELVGAKFPQVPAEITAFTPKNSNAGKSQQGFRDRLPAKSAPAMSAKQIKALMKSVKR